MPVGSLTVRTPPEVAAIDLWPETSTSDLVFDGTRCQLDGTRWGCEDAQDVPGVAGPMKHGAEEDCGYGTVAPAMNASLNAERHGARGTAIVVSVALLVLCVVCIAVKEPAGTKPFWHFIVRFKYLISIQRGNSIGIQI